MAVHTWGYDPAEGPILNVEVSSYSAVTSLMIPMLLDTGADGSSVSPQLLSRLGCAPIGKRTTFASAGAQEQVHTYLIDMSIPTGATSHLFDGLVVAEFRFDKPSIRGLIGRDLLARANFCMRADHTCTLEFIG